MDTNAKVDGRATPWNGGRSSLKSPSKRATQLPHGSPRHI